MILKNSKKIGVIILSGALIIAGLQFMQNITAKSDYTNDDFYVLDENGLPIKITYTDEDIEQLKQQQQDEEYKVVTTVRNRDYTLGTFDNYDDAVEVYNDELDSANVSIRSRSRSSVEDVKLLSNDNTIASKSDIIGVVQFKRELDSNNYVKNINYTEVKTGRSGYLNPVSIADAAYIRTDGNYTICKMGGVEIKVSTSKVADIVAYNEYKNLSYYTISNGYLIHYFSYYSGANKISMSSTRVGYKPSYLSNGVKYYSYDGHYFYQSFTDMIEDYRNGNYNQAINKNSPYYNYYQYLSLRTKTKLSASQYNTRVNNVVSNPSESKMYNKGQSFINAQNTYGINANMIFGVAANESAYGTSSIARNKNNIFGLNAVDSSPGQSANYFASVEQCINEFAYNWMSTGYLDTVDSRYRGPHLGDKNSGINVKYASDPYWGEKAAAQPYYIDTSKTDYGRYDIGIAAKTEISFYAQASTSSARIYTSGAVGSGTKAYMYDFPVVILGTVKGSDGNTWYKVQSDVALNDNRTKKDVEAKYRYSRDYVYVKANDVKLVFDGNGNIDTSDSDTSKPDPTPSYTKGDVNNDGKISPADYVMIKNHIMKTYILSGNGLLAADVNGDGVVSPADYVMVKNMIMS